MGYRVIPRKTKSGVAFKIMFETFIGGRRSRTVPKSDWSVLQFSPSMTLDEAKQRARELNQFDRITRQETRRQRIKDRLELESAQDREFFPPLLLAEFERLYITRATRDKKAPRHWVVCKRILKELKIDPAFWVDRAPDFYDLFARKRYSLSYCRTLTTYLNQWGSFYQRHRKQYFERLRLPKGQNNTAIQRANREKAVRTGNKVSSSLYPTLLESKRLRLEEAQYNWLYLTVWFGLRPIEVDLLTQPQGPGTWAYHPHTKTLYVTQPKLISHEGSYKRKTIRVLLPAQEHAIDVLLHQPIKRPSSKKVGEVFGSQYGLYSGRKGFTKLMKYFGYGLEDVARWMGHSNINTTWRWYEDKEHDYTHEHVG